MLMRTAKPHIASCAKFSAVAHVSVATFEELHETEGQTCLISMSQAPAAGHKNQAAETQTLNIQAVSLADCAQQGCVIMNNLLFALAVA